MELCYFTQWKQHRHKTQDVSRFNFSTLCCVRVMYSSPFRAKSWWRKCVFTARIQKKGKYLNLITLHAPIKDVSGFKKSNAGLY